MTYFYKISLSSTCALLVLSACSGQQETGNAAATNETANAHAGTEIPEIALSAEQIKEAGIDLIRPTSGGNGTLSLPALIEGDPQGTQVVSAAIGGRIVSLTRNLGEAVRHGETLAIIESREAASLKAEVEAASARASLAQSNLRREERLFTERVSPEQDLIAARTAAAEAQIALRLARQQLSAAGAGGGGLNRIGITAPISGQVIARSVTLGQTVAADAELFHIANLSRVAVTISLSPSDAARVRPGALVDVHSGDRKASARIHFVSPVLDEETRLVTVIALIDNRAGQWRVGEPVSTAIHISGHLSGSAGPSGAFLVPADAVQTVNGKPTLFIRTAKGFRAVPVTLGETSGDRVVIASGLSGQEEIAGQGSFTLKAELGKGSGEGDD